MAEQTIEQLEIELEVVYSALLSVRRNLGPGDRRNAMADRLRAMREVLEMASQLAAPPDEPWTKYRARELQAARSRQRIAG